MDNISLSMNFVALVLSALSILVAVIFFIAANRANREANALTNNIQLLLDNMEKTIGNKGIRQDELISNLLEKRDNIAESVIDKLLTRIEDITGFSPKTQEERQVLTDELIEVASSSLQNYAESELVPSLETQRDKILQSISDIDVKLEDKHSVSVKQKRQYEEQKWKLRQELDNVKNRIRSITGHT